MSTDALPTASRALLFPGPVRPASHLGLTLARHLVATGLRYALHHLGLPLPEAPPVRLTQLRLYLDGRSLSALLGEVEGGDEVVAAILEPGAAGRLPRTARRLRSAVAVHRWRLRLARRPRAAAPSEKPEGSPAELFRTLRAEISRQAEPVGEGVLAEIVGALDRRAARLVGREQPWCLPPEAVRLLRGRGAPLGLFGAPDPRLPSWAATPQVARRAIAARLAADSAEPMPPEHRLRGRFRLAYRAALDAVRRPLIAFADDACRRGVLDKADDAFFLPWELLDDLAAERRPAWLGDAVASNRREHATLSEVSEPQDVFYGGPRPKEPSPDEAELEAGPLTPLA